MQQAVLLFLCGLLLFQQQSDLPNAWYLLVVLPTLWALHRGGYWRWPACLAAGFLWAWLWALPALHLQLPAELEKVDLQVEGWVASIPKRFSRSTRFLFRVQTLRYGERRLPFSGKLRLSWYQAPAPLLFAGERWQFTVRLKRPRGLSNPGGFDFAGWLLRNGIYATGYIRNQSVPVKQATHERYPVTRMRQSVAEHIAEQLGDRWQYGMLTALAVGDRQYISADQWQVLSRTGTSHLMAISGLHIGLIAGLMALFIRRIWPWLPGLAMRYPASKAAAVGALLGATGYALLAGFSLPTQRALVMLLVALLALIWQRPLQPSRTLSFALLAVLLFDPHAPLSAGFWLSFAAVAVLLYVLVGRSTARRSLGQWLYVQAAILLALLPVSLLVFQSATPISPVANLIAIPWVSVTVVPLTLLAVLVGWISETLYYGLLQLAALTLAWLWGFLDWLARWPWAQIALPTPPLWTLVFAIPGIMLLLAPPAIPARWVGLVLCFPLVFFPLPRPEPGALWFTLLDVGQGLAVVVRTADHVLIYDTGPRLGAGFDAARVALIPFLRQQGIRHIDRLVISHADSQHSGGVRSLREAFSIGQILTSQPEQVPVPDIQACQAGQRWIWDQVELAFLHPPAEHSLSADNASCVLRIKTYDQQILLTGDIEASAEVMLLQRFSESLRSDILIAPHHGNRHNRLIFLQAVQPRFILLSTAYKNRYGYPKPETLQVYQTLGAQALDTAQSGAITFRIESPSLAQPERHRVRARRYWHSR